MTREQVDIVQGQTRVTVDAPKGEAWPLAQRISETMRRIHRPIPVFEMTDVELAQQYFEAP